MWWKRTTVYQIYPRSFYDSDGDGIGDLRGVIAKLGYLQELGVETLWLSPFFRSPQADFGYDISDHYSIAPEFGTTDDCHALVDEVHRRGMKIVFDMVLNHTSAEHPWFLESKSAIDHPRRDWYIWRRGKKPGGKAPPNNWRSMIGGSGWHHDPVSDEWYFASFLGFQPDLNYRNPEVKAAMLDVVRYWLGQGVDGLRLDIFNAIFKDASFVDNPFSWRPAPSEENPNGFFQRHQHTIDHPDTLAFARELRQVVDQFDEPRRFLVGEVFGNLEDVKRYCGEAADGLHLVFLFKTLKLGFSARRVRELVTEFERSFSEPFTPTYVFSNHDRLRSSHRFNTVKAKLLTTLQLTVRGVPFIYYGEELGMENHEIPLHEGLDPVAARFGYMPRFAVRWLRRRGILLNRDECRSPMQWTSGVNAGFTDGKKPWLAVHPNSATVNVERQEQDPQSLLWCYRNLLALRARVPALQAGSLEWIPVAPKVVGYRRQLGDERADVFLNFSARAQILPLDGYDGFELFSNHARITDVIPSSYILAPYEGVVLSRAPSSA